MMKQNDDKSFPSSDATVLYPSTPGLEGMHRAKKCNGAEMKRWIIEYSQLATNTKTEAYRATVGRTSSARPNATQGICEPRVCVGRQVVG